MLDLLTNIEVYNLFIHEILHVFLATIFGFFIFWKTKSYKRIIAVVIVSILVDVDHLYDYLLWSGGSVNFSDMFGVQYFIENGKAYVFFHAWEWALILGILTIWRGWRSIFAILFFALVSQLIVDTITVNSFQFYFITYRITQGFVLP